MKIKNEAGEEIEVFSQEEADALAKQKAEEAVAAAKADAEAEKQTLADEKAELEEKLKKLEDKDFNFSQFRKKNEKDNEELKTLKTRLDEVTGKITQLETQPFEKMKNEFMASNGITADAELKKKFDFFFEPLGKVAKDEAAMQAALTGAFAAATGGAKQPNFSGMMVSTRVTPPSKGEGAVSEVSKNIGAALGITDKDREEHRKRHGK